MYYTVPRVYFFFRSFFLEVLVILHSLSVASRLHFHSRYTIVDISWSVEFLVSTIYTRHFPFISRCTFIQPLVSPPSSFLSAFFPGRGTIISLVIRLAACSSLGRATLHPVDCIPFGLPRTNASFDGRSSRKTLFSLVSQSFPARSSAENILARSTF